jgi:hypothetical protein
MILGKFNRSGIIRFAEMMRDRARIFGDHFTRQVQILGVEQVLSAPRPPSKRHVSSASSASSGGTASIMCSSFAKRAAQAGEIIRGL